MSNKKVQKKNIEKLKKYFRKNGIDFTANSKTDRNPVTCTQADKKFLSGKSGRL